jgi:RimJ/RimL family protein N-acetyltransferase
LQDATERLKLRRLLAITTIDNESSIKLLKRLGFRLERVTKLAADREPVNLFTKDLNNLVNLF